MHVTELPPLNACSLGFGFNPGEMDNTPAVRVNVSFFVNGAGSNPIRICTYDSVYKISGEGLVIEEDIYTCCMHATSSMKNFLQFDAIGRKIPPELILCPAKEVFGEDLINIAKALNAIDGKRGFPLPQA